MVKPGEESVFDMKKSVRHFCGALLVLVCAYACAQELEPTTPATAESALGAVHEAVKKRLDAEGRAGLDRLTGARRPREIGGLCEGRVGQGANHGYRLEIDQGGPEPARVNHGRLCERRWQNTEFGLGRLRIRGQDIPLDLLPRNFVEQVRRRFPRADADLRRRFPRADGGLRYGVHAIGWRLRIFLPETLGIFFPKALCRWRDFDHARTDDDLGDNFPFWELL
jgi:hypothetical protein